MVGPLAASRDSPNDGRVPTARGGAVCPSCVAVDREVTQVRGNGRPMICPHAA